jgi:Family of unknown function (DUF6196)
MHRSHETPEQTETRLHRVIREATLYVFPDTYRFVPLPLAEFPFRARAEAQAFVRDDAVWSQLVPADEGPSRCVLFRFHFPEGVDNSGFVGWLASLIKRETGAGAFVVCGENPAQGGIFDLWGVDLQVGAEVLSIVRALRGAPGRSPDARRSS